MDLTCFNWVQLIKKSELPSNAKLLGFYLSTFMNAEHNIAWPSQSRISDETGLTEPTIRKYLTIMQDQGWLIIKKNIHHVNTGKQNYLHNEYLINIPQGVISLLADQSRGKNERHQGVNSSLAGGKEFTPNNNRITKNNNLSKETKLSTQKITTPPWADNEGWKLVGSQFDIKPRNGESWDDFKNRVKRRLYD